MSRFDDAIAMTNNYEWVVVFYRPQDSENVIIEHMTFYNKEPDYLDMFMLMEEIRNNPEKFEIASFLDELQVSIIPMETFKETIEPFLRKEHENNDNFPMPFEGE